MPLLAMLAYIKGKSRMRFSLVSHLTWTASRLSSCWCAAVNFITFYIILVAVYMISISIPLSSRRSHYSKLSYIFFLVSDGLERRRLLRVRQDGGRVSEDRSYAQFQRFNVIVLTPRPSLAKEKNLRTTASCTCLRLFVRANNVGPRAQIQVLRAFMARENELFHIKAASA